MVYSHIIPLVTFSSLVSDFSYLNLQFYFFIFLQPIGSSKLNIQNPLKCLCAEDAKTLQKWVDALRLAKVIGCSYLMEMLKFLCILCCI